MDDLVKAALRKWPNVPACYDWLGLDARGQWWMRDERTQAAGPFPLVKGSRIEHEKLRDFIHRNYECDAQGAWFFQNGPQRVYVTLEVTPWVWRVMDTPGHPVYSHTGHPALVQGAWLDEQGRLFLTTDIGPGLVHSLDVAAAAQALEAGDWVLSPGRSVGEPVSVQAADLPRRWGFVLRPGRN
ncbi:MAG: DUF2946 family protein [Burkholderiaceae bacterium]|jgi:hypothetical protein